MTALQRFICVVDPYVPDAMTMPKGVLIAICVAGVAAYVGLLLVLVLGAAHSAKVQRAHADLQDQLAQERERADKEARGEHVFNAVQRGRGAA